MARSTIHILIMLSIPAAAVLAAVALAAIIYDIPVGDLTRDAAHTAEFHPLLGVLSNICVLLWATTTAICLFTGVVVRDRNAEMRTTFLIGFGLLNLVLLLDDFFLFHDCLAQECLGIRERYVYLVYMGLTAGCLIVFRKVIAASEYPLLMIAMAFFIISTSFDAIHRGKNSWMTFYEDGTKFLGLVAWAAYFVRFCSGEIAGALCRAGQPSDVSISEEHDSIPAHSGGHVPSCPACSSVRKRFDAFRGREWPRRSYTN